MRGKREIIVSLGLALLCLLTAQPQLAAADGRLSDDRMASSYPASDSTLPRDSLSASAKEQKGLSLDLPEPEPGDAFPEGETALDDEALLADLKQSLEDLKGVAAVFAASDEAAAAQVIAEACSPEDDDFGRFDPLDGGEVQAETCRRYATCILKNACREKLYRAETFSAACNIMGVDETEFRKILAFGSDEVTE